MTRLAVVVLLLSFSMSGCMLLQPRRLADLLAPGAAGDIIRGVVCQASVPVPGTAVVMRPGLRSTANLDLEFEADVGRVTLDMGDALLVARDDGQRSITDRCLASFQVLVPSNRDADLKRARLLSAGDQVVVAGTMQPNGVLIARTVRLYR